MENNPVKAKQETRSVDFKSAFDPDLKGDWCELIKDLVAMANSGGGTILIGVDDNGKYAKNPQALKVLKTDPSVITDKVSKYTGTQFDAFTVNEGKRAGRKIAIITVGIADAPMMFEKPGMYGVEHDKKEQKCAFSAGTLYVRHGAKSEPARTADLSRLMQKTIARARKEWLSSVKKVVTAPAGSTVSVLPPRVVQSKSPTATPIRITNDPDAPEYQIIDPDKTHPWRQKELLQQLNKSLPTPINQFDLLTVRHLYGVQKDTTFVHKPRFGAPQYSPAFAKWLIKQHSRDPSFFSKARAKYKRRQPQKR